jgi:hypothetical protein
MRSLSAQKVAGIFGLIFVVLTLVGGFIAPFPPDPDEAPAKFLAYYARNRSILLAQAVISLAGIIAVFPFVGGFWNKLRAADGEGGILAISAIAAFILTGAIATILSAWTGGLAMLANNGLDETNAKAFTFVFDFIGNGIYAPLAAMSLSSGYLFVTKGGLPKWGGWLGIVLGIVQGVAIGEVATSGLFTPFGPLGLVSFVGFMLYTAIISVFMLRGSD